MITNIHLSNFRAIQSEVNVRLRPITVLIGKNSAGKSSLIKFLVTHYGEDVPARRGGLGAGSKSSSDFWRAGTASRLRDFGEDYPTARTRRRLRCGRTLPARGCSADCLVCCFAGCLTCEGFPVQGWSFCYGDPSGKCWPCRLGSRRYSRLGSLRYGGGRGRWEVA